jgi:recombination protein RecA
MYGEGVSRLGELIDLSVEHEVVQKSGAWFAYKGEKIGQGKEAVRAFLKANPVLEAEISEEVKRRVFAKPEEAKK